MNPRGRPLLLPIAAAALLSACAGTVPRVDTPPVAPAWQAPLPAVTADASPAALVPWWTRFDDPSVAAIVQAAQQASPDLSSATARIAQARLARVAAGAALLPAVDGSAGISRGRSDPSLPIARTANAGLQAAWEIDLFGANTAGRNAAQARLEGAEATWHATRVAVAAEAASTYVALRACEAQLVQTDIDAASRNESARLTELSANAGFQAPADAALARASAAQGRSQQVQQRAACATLVKGLVAITAIDEPALRQQLAARTATLPKAADIGVAAVPAALLQQRPDLFLAAREVAAAAADEAQAQADRWPRVSLSGSIGRVRVSTSEGSLTGNIWSVGPLQVTLPIFDAGRRAANAQAARAAYDNAVVQYQASVRTAVREVEEALVSLDSTGARASDATVAVDGFEASLRATESLQRSGLANLFDLETARRSAVTARIARIDLERERLQAWVTLYRALGGGWSEELRIAAAGPQSIHNGKAP